MSDVLQPNGNGSASASGGACERQKRLRAVAVHPLTQAHALANLLTR